MSETSPVERWLPIPGHQGYEASDLGRIRSVDRVIQHRNGHSQRYRGTILRPSLAGSNDGRLAVKVAGQRNRYVHQLVLETFVGPRPQGPNIDGCHNDGDPLNNNLTNLRWDSTSENMYDKVRHGTDPHRNVTHCPRGHNLEVPNLVASNAGFRSCLACNRAYADRAYASSRGWAFDFERAADDHYRRIIDSPVRICPQCSGPLAPTLIRSAIYCGRRCRSQAWARRARRARITPQ